MVAKEFREMKYKKAQGTAKQLRNFKQFMSDEETKITRMQDTSEV